MRATKKHLEALAAAVDYLTAEGLPIAETLKDLLERFNEKAKDNSDPNSLPLARIEALLVAHSGSKVVPIKGAGSQFWIKQYQLWKPYNVTEPQLALVASWLAAQVWLQGSLTVADVGYKWPQYLAKAQGEADRRGPNQRARKEFTGE